MKKSAYLIAGLVLAACTTPPGEAPVEPSSASVAASDEQPVSCEAPYGYGGYAFWIEAPAVPPGATLVLQPWYMSQPGVMDPVPASCLEGVEISGPGSLGEDGRTVVVDADAGAGAAIHVRGKVGDAGISGRILVFHEETQPLVGVWHQPEEACAGTTPVRELIFDPDGRFSLTWTPFEVYKDYWGGYTFNDGRLALKPDGGNHTPTDASFVGDVQLDSDTLVISPEQFGNPSSGLSCSAPFQR
jgi:hypothetical protein